MYVDQALEGSCLVHIFPGGKASQNITVLDEAKQLWTKCGDFLNILTLFALVSVRAFKSQGTESQHAKAMVHATTHIFQSLSKARSTSLGVLHAGLAEWAKGSSLAPELSKHEAPQLRILGAGRSKEGKGLGARSQPIVSCSLLIQMSYIQPKQFHNQHCHH